MLYSFLFYFYSNPFLVWRWFLVIFLSRWVFSPQSHPFYTKRTLLIGAVTLTSSVNHTPRGETTPVFYVRLLSGREWGGGGGGLRVYVSGPLPSLSVNSEVPWRFNTLVRRNLFVGQYSICLAFLWVYVRTLPFTHTKKKKRKKNVQPNPSRTLPYSLDLTEKPTKEFQYQLYWLHSKMNFFLHYELRVL